MTVRIRYDPSFPHDRFISLRKHTIGDDPESGDSAEVVDPEAALRLVQTWFEEIPEPWR